MTLSVLNNGNVSMEQHQALLTEVLCSDPIGIPKGILKILFQYHTLPKPAGPIQLMYETIVDLTKGRNSYNEVDGDRDSFIKDVVGLNAARVREMFDQRGFVSIFIDRMNVEMKKSKTLLVYNTISLTLSCYIDSPTLKEGPEEDTYYLEISTLGDYVTITHRYSSTIEDHSNKESDEPDHVPAGGTVSSNSSCSTLSSDVKSLDSAN